MNAQTVPCRVNYTANVEKLVVTDHKFLFWKWKRASMEDVGKITATRNDIIPIALLKSGVYYEHGSVDDEMRHITWENDKTRASIYVRERGQSKGLQSAVERGKEIESGNTWSFFGVYSRGVVPDEVALRLAELEAEGWTTAKYVENE